MMAYFKNLTPSHPMIVGLFSQNSSISNPAAQDLHFAMFALQHVFALLLSLRCLPRIFNHANIINQYSCTEKLITQNCYMYNYKVSVLP